MATVASTPSTAEFITTCIRIDSCAVSQANILLRASGRLDPGESTAGVLATFAGNAHRWTVGKCLGITVAMDRRR